MGKSSLAGSRPLNPVIAYTDLDNMSRVYRIKHVSELDPLVRDTVLRFYQRQEQLAVEQERYEDAARWRDAADMGIVVNPPEDFWKGFTKGEPYRPLEDLF